MLLYILRFLLCLDIGYDKKSQEIKDVKELKDDLFKYAYCHLDIAFKKPEIISSEFESSGVMEIVGGDKAAKLVVNEWSREHFGMETLAFSTYLFQWTLDNLKDKKEYENLLSMPSSALSSHQTFNTILWFYFKATFPPYARIRRYKDQNAAMEALEELQGTVNRRMVQQNDHANRSSRKN